jgi:hypothetical protein
VTGRSPKYWCSKDSKPFRLNPKINFLDFSDPQVPNISTSPSLDFKTCINMVICHTNARHMDIKKRRTMLRHTCGQCYRSYSRRWVLKRHLLQQHGVQHLADSGSTPLVASYQTAFPNDLLGFMAMTSFYDKTAEKRPVDSDVPLDQIAPKARVLAFNAIKPIYEATKLALQKQATFSKTGGTSTFLFRRF